MNDKPKVIRYRGIEYTLIKRVNLGLQVTHNGDGLYQRVWGVTAAGEIFRTSSYGGNYKPMLLQETPPAELGGFK